MDFRTITENGRHGVRVVAIIIRDNSLLAYKVDDQHHLVGGAISVGESTQVAIAREVKEELGLDCDVLDLMFIVENKFDFEGELHHMIEFHYKVEIFGEVPEKILDGVPYECEWIPLNDIDNFNIWPPFLKEKLAQWDGHIQHVDVNL